MAVKDGIQVIKDGLNAQEQFLENMIRGERFFKKYKFVFFIVAIVSVVAIVGYYTMQTLESDRIAKANIAYEKALANDINALNSLETDAPSLWALVKFKKFQDTNDTEGVKSLIRVNIDPILNQIFSAYVGNTNGKILADYNALTNGYELLKQDKIKEANVEFAKISANSPLISLVKNLQHYQGIKQ